MNKFKIPEGSLTIKEASELAENDPNDPRIKMATSIIKNLKNRINSVLSNSSSPYNNLTTSPIIEDTKGSNNTSELANIIYPYESKKNRIPKAILQLIIEDIKVRKFDIAKLISPKLTMTQFRDKTKGIQICKRINHKLQRINKHLKKHDLFISQDGDYVILLAKSNS